MKEFFKIWGMLYVVALLVFILPDWFVTYTRAFVYWQHPYPFDWFATRFLLVVAAPASLLGTIISYSESDGWCD